MKLTGELNCCIKPGIDDRIILISLERRSVLLMRGSKYDESRSSEG